MLQVLDLFVCHQLVQNFLALCLTAKARSAVDFIHFGFVPTYPCFLFFTFLESEGRM